jgi:hypothetical protein
MTIFGKISLFSEYAFEIKLYFNSAGREKKLV